MAVFVKAYHPPFGGIILIRWEQDQKTKAPSILKISGWQFYQMQANGLFHTAITFGIDIIYGWPWAWPWT